MNERMRVAVVGAGRAALHHVAALNGAREIEIAAVADLDEGRATALAQQARAIACSLEQILEDETIDAIAICTPPGEHLQLALQALERSKAVLLEKPPVLCEADLDLLLAASQVAGRPVAVMLQHRGRLPAAARTHTWTAQASATVEVFRRRAASHFQLTWRSDPDAAGGGVLAHLAVHYLDLACCLFGEPVAVEAVADFGAGPGIDTRVGLLVLFGEGGLLSGHASVHPEGKATRLLVRDGASTLVVDESESRYAIAGRRGRSPAPPTARLRRGVYEQLALNLRGGAPIDSDIRECRAITKLLEKASESAACASR